MTDPNSVANINKVFENSMKKQGKHRFLQLQQQKNQAKETTTYWKEQLLIKKREIAMLARDNRGRK